MEKIKFGKYQEEVLIEVNGIATRVMVDNYKREQLVKRASNGRFQQYMYTLKFKGDRLSLLIGIFMAEVIILLAII